MNNFPLPWLISACFLSSDRLLNAAINNDFSAKMQKQNLQQAIKDFQGYLSAPLRQEDIDFALNISLQNKTELDFILQLKKLQHDFLLWRGDKFEVNPLLLENWLSCLSLIDPAWIIGFAYADMLKNGTLSTQQVISLLTKQCPNALITRLDSKSIADNHVHHGGHGNSNLSLASFILHLNQKPNNKSWPYRKEHALFNCDENKKYLLPQLLNYLFNLLLTNDKNAKSVSWHDIEIYQPKNHANIIAYLTSEKIPYFQLLKAALNYNGTISWLLITTYICLVLFQAKKIQKKHAQMFIQASHIFRNYMVVSGVGLGDFVDFFAFDYRKPIAYFDYAKHSLFYDLHPHHLREFRVAKDDSSFFKNIAQDAIQQQITDQIHFVYHFNRSLSKDESQDRSYYKARDNANKQVKNLTYFLRSSSFDSYPIFNHEQKKSKRVDLRAMLRGFDVAGNENHLPIEVFAPAIRYLRSARYKHRFPLEKRLRLPFVTLHAGEDFNHILTGLRAIDEATLFCDYQAGDRIGHGLALGIDVYQWAARQQYCYIPLQNHLDNLVWCYHQACLLIVHHPDFQSVIPLLEGKIARFSRQLFGQSHSADLLYQAWHLRRNCPLTNIQTSQVLGEELNFKAPDANMILQAQQSKNRHHSPYHLWQDYLKQKRHDLDNKQLITLRFELTESIIEQPKINLLDDTVTLTELKLFHAIQDMMLEKFSQNDWILEACPTSNIYIARLNSYQEHPIFRWDPPKAKDLIPSQKANIFGIRHGPIKVCINTDDAALMPTNLENEYAIIQKCAIQYFQTSNQEADLWINKIRQTGVDIFKQNHIKWA